MIKSKLLVASAILFCSRGLLAGKLSIIEKGREFIVKTTTLEADVKDGMIVALKDLKTGKIWAKRQINDTRIPVGLGVLYDLKTFKQGHIPWGEPTLKQHLKPDFKLNNYFRPTSQSHFQLIKNKNKVKAIWTGLSNGEKFLSKAKFSMIIGTDKSGALTLQTTGFNPQGKIFGTLAPITNLDNDATYILPSFGGMGHSKAGVPALMPMYRPPFVEAPVMIGQNRHKSIAFWFENPRQRPFYQFLNRSGKSFAMIFENMPLMPFEAHKKYTSPVLKINVFDGDWKAAATPYRNWYRNYYKKEIAIRDGVPWAKKIYVVIDSYMHAPKDTVITKIAKIYPKGSVLYQNWNARACRHDRDLPDWTPRTKYISGIDRLHKYGIKTMAYTNTYCANYKSKVWDKDHLSSFFLTRKNSPYLYKSKSIGDTENTLNEKLIGTIDYTDSKDQFANIKPGRLLYVDPLASRWRQYHADMMKWWNTTTKTDANYEDTAGSIGDFGNGIVDGLSAGEGSIAQMKILQKIQSKVPMSTEYGPDGIAFATCWALNYASHWGYDDFKRYRINNQYPLTVYLYGYRQWVTALNDSTDLRKHVQASSSDACGGMGFSLVNYFRRESIAELNENYSFKGHFFLRSKLFAAKSLTPCFPEGNYPDNIRCMYKGIDGIYSYYDDGKLQLMLGPDNQELYGRVFGANEVRTKLWLSNWPLQDGQKIFGLNPAYHYPLFAKPETVPLPAITLDALPANILLTKYYDAPEFTYMEFNGKADILSLKLKLSQRFKEFYVNDKKVDIKNIKGKLPLRLLAVKKTAQTKFTENPLTRTISAGRMVGKASPLKYKRKHIVRGQKLYWLKDKSAYVDYLLKVPTKNSAIEVYFQNLAPDSRHGCDASIVRCLINGKEIKSYDARSKNPAGTPKYLFDTKLHSWNIPVGKYAGKTILVTLVSDWKQSSNWDKQYIGIPFLTLSAKQQSEFKIW
jgi:hypothetical protein